jgi:putative acetyltransferase
VRIRRGTPEDVTRALEIWRSAVDATHRFLTPEDRREIDVIVAEQFLPNAGLWLAIDDADRPMGFMTMHGSAIDALFVDAAAHGQGYGTLLVDHARSLHPNLTVDANEQAANAVAFYLSRGFRAVGRSEIDGEGRPYPLIHLALAAS